MTDLKPDIVRLILSDHETFQRRSRSSPTCATSRRPPRCCGRAAAHLEVHASAEEAHFYPALLQKVDDSEDETKDAIHDHDEIRQGIRRAAAAEAGGDEWWAGIQDAREANDEHLAEEERDDLPDFLRSGVGGGPPGTRSPLHEVQGRAPVGGRPGLLGQGSRRVREAERLTRGPEDAARHRPPPRSHREGRAAPEPGRTSPTPTAR